ncbi:circularly permuted type 2 ATP-grasp protein [Klebsiella pneumoniae subsp. pneumoniae]|nr:circularly permuted type 2 ATP-grasp protein [Klebsiella pneumoniae subsp. pneumoniae]
MQCRKAEDLRYAEQSRAGGQGGPWRRATVARVRLKRVPSASAFAGQSATTISPKFLALSTCPTFVDEGLPRHIDLRPAVLSGRRCGWCPAA